jgi:hypothetical protein
MSAPMVRALLDGTKTQTRRVLKTQPLDVLPMNGEPPPGWVALLQKDPNRGTMFRCKYGKVGDRLWVKETWALHPDNHPAEAGAVYRATDPDWECEDGWKWKPSIFMPRWASRITLEITGVRVERLQDISSRDAVAEGMRGDYFHGDLGNVGDKYQTARDQYRDLWNEINGKGSWDKNPFVWAISFKRIETPTTPQ